MRTKEVWFENLAISNRQQEKANQGEKARETEGDGKSQSKSERDSVSTHQDPQWVDLVTAPDACSSVVRGGGKVNPQRCKLEIPNLRRNA